ncbi:hypothetical protein K450DRAFT_279803 [Umbelopsis ramanniana AG]|uniref:Zn(2)-C6 fungal-type domain-containing protein n=1 Tax=Umbelopsis ramanniana AG TaxID=1314678 RepID=A0AAD5ECT1_UMBRA|nr:uncharacterized protein K450DRAFT_279803 [Umbelopsis ramanniana AG]KAI8580601.1 hypothetical protein K450DRAFT_279803 [Umbelopsis ramanniana AG]
MAEDSEQDRTSNAGAACYRCRGFRHSCDREKPACSRCKRRGIKCIYPEAAPSLKQLQLSADVLGNRITTLNEKLKQRPKSEKSIAKQPQSVAEEIPTDALVGNFSVYPCSKCYRDLQQCDLTFPSCSRCVRNKFECVYTKTEPKANHVSTVLNAMNRAVDQWNDFFDGKSKWLAKRTQRDILPKKKPRPPFTWAIHNKYNQGLSMESNVSSFTDLHKLIAQFAYSFLPTPRSIQDSPDAMSDSDFESVEEGMISDLNQMATADLRQDMFPFAIWNAWSVSMHSLPQGYPIDTSEQLTNQLVELFCTSPCCSTSRLPFIEPADVLQRYQKNENPPSKLYIYALCAMSARNAFQVHCWSGDSGFSAAQFTMGKAISTAYCVQAREIFADCFDSPSLDNVQGTFLLSYAMHQNGYFNGIYLYEWISFALAQDLGLYDAKRPLTRAENMTLWMIYYYNAWYKVLQGGACDAVHLNQYYPAAQPIMPPPPLEKPINSQDLIYTMWYHLVKLQVLRHDLMSRMVIAQEAYRRQAPFRIDLFELQQTLFDCYATVPLDWQNPDSEMLLNASGRPTLEANSSSGKLNVKTDDVNSFCIINLHVHYNINKILLYQTFLPTNSPPTTPIAVQCLSACIQAANSITECLDIMINKRKDCNLPILALVFANTIYMKLLTYTDVRFKRFARRNLERSVSLSKSSMTYAYDFENCKRLVSIMESTVNEAISRLENEPSPSGSECSLDGGINKGIPPGQVRSIIKSNAVTSSSTDMDQQLASSYSSNSSAPELEIPVKREHGSRDSYSVASSVTYQDDTPASLEKSWPEDDLDFNKYPMDVDKEPRIKLEHHEDGFSGDNSLIKDVWRAVDDARCSV